MGKLDTSKIHADSDASSFVFYGSDQEVAYSDAVNYANRFAISPFDIIEIEPEVGDSNSKSEIKIKAVRELIRQLNLTPGHGKFKLAIVRDADKLNLEAANTLLKTLEEPPASAKIILLSSGLKLIPTIKSRCQIVRVKDGETDDKKELFAEFESAISSRLKGSFKSANEMAESKNLEHDFDVIISMLRRKMLETGEKSGSKMIKLLIEAKKNFKMTTNKRLVIENLFLELKYGNYSD